MECFKYGHYVHDLESSCPAFKYKLRIRLREWAKKVRRR